MVGLKPLVLITLHLKGEIGVKMNESEPLGELQRGTEYDCSAFTNKKQPPHSYCQLIGGQWHGIVRLLMLS